MIKIIAQTILLGSQNVGAYWNFPTKEKFIQFFDGWITLKKHHIVKTLNTLKQTGKTTFRIENQKGENITLSIDDFISELNLIPKEVVLKKGEQLYLKKFEEDNFNKKTEDFLTGPYSYPVYSSLVSLIISRFVASYIELRLTSDFTQLQIIPEELLLEELLKNKRNRADELYFKLIHARGINKEEFTRKGLSFLYNYFTELMLKYSLTDHDALALIK